MLRNVFITSLHLVDDQPTVEGFFSTRYYSKRGCSEGDFLAPGEMSQDRGHSRIWPQLDMSIQPAMSTNSLEGSLRTLLAVFHTNSSRRQQVS